MKSMAADRGQKGDTAFADVRQRWLDTFASMNTRAAYAVDLARFGQWCATHEALPLHADAATIAAFHLAQQTAGHSVATQRRRWSALSSFFDYAVEIGVSTVNPTDTGQRPTVDTASSTMTLSPQAVEAYLAAAKALDPRLDALVSLLVLDGLKLGEALALDVDDVRGRPPVLTVRIRRRGTDTRVPLQRASARAVSRCAGRRAGEPLFVSRPKRGAAHRLTRFGADHLLKKLAVDPDGAAVTYNALRRYHITAHHDTGADLDTVRQRAGLDDIRSVRRYLPSNESSDRQLEEEPHSSATGSPRSRKRRP